MSNRTTASTLFNLKDEYLKAKQEKLGLSDTKPENKRKKLKQIIHYQHEEKSKAAAVRREKERKRAARLALTEQEQEDLRQSRSVLEAKSAIYDKLSREQGQEHSDNLLVDFTQKPESTAGIAYDYSSQSSSSRAYRTDSTREEERGPAEVHFANVDHGEVRSKGVGYYSFSEDPLTRKQQMEFLDSMRDSTERSRELFQAGRRKRRQEKLDRLNRIRRKHGLPYLDKLPGEKQEEEEEEGETPDTAETDTQPTPPHNIEEMFLRREKTLWERKVEELRAEREEQFAPYYDTGAGNHGNTGYPGNAEEEIDEASDEIVNFISFVRKTT